MATPRRRIAAIATIAVGAALPSMATAEPSLLFSQSAGTASARPVTGAVADVTLRTAHRPVLAFEDRPGRRTATLPEHKFIGLWRGTFSTDAPNAILTGRDPQGRNRRVVVTITRAARTPDGVRYRMRALRGAMPPALAQANLMVDDVPMSAVLAYLDRSNAEAAQYELLINALRFPAAVTVTSAQSLAVRPGTTATLGLGNGAPVGLTFGSVTVQAGATLVIQGRVNISAQSLTLAPGARIVLPDSPTLVALQAFGLPVCAPPDAFTWSGTLTQTRALVPPIPGVNLVQPPVQPSSATSVIARQGGTSCTVTWGFTVPQPSRQPVVMSGLPTSPAYPQSTRSVMVLTTSTTQQVVEVSGTGFTASGGALLTVVQASGG